MEDQPTIQSLLEENKKLTEELTQAKIRLDESMEHTPITRVRKLNPKKSFNVKRVAEYCTKHNLKVITVYNSYGNGNYNYPNSAWRAVYPKLILPDTFFTNGL
jgi:hypothetical protein